MCRKGIPEPKITAGAGVAASVVRYHLAIAAKQDPGLRQEHKAAPPAPPPRVTDAGRRNLAGVAAFYEAEGRLPVNGRSAKESALAGWLTHRRQERLVEVAAWLAAGHDWPKHNKTDDPEERTLGVWLHTQRPTLGPGSSPHPRKPN